MSNTALSAWMRNHLRVVTLPYPDRGTLAVLEHAVLARLDPPLNLDGDDPNPDPYGLRRPRSALSAAFH